MKTKKINIVFLTCCFLLLLTSLFNNINLNIRGINTIISYINMISISTVFLISGAYFYSLYKEFTKNNNIYSYYKKILLSFYIPYLCLILLNVILKDFNMKDFIIHAFLLQNLFFDISISISELSWIFATIFQFALLLPLIAQYIEKKPNICLLLANLISLLAKFVGYIIISKYQYSPVEYYYILNFQLISSLELFTSGIYFLQKNIGNNKNKIYNLLMITCCIIILTVLSLHNNFQLYGNGFSISLIYNVLSILLLNLFIVSFNNYASTNILQIPYKFFMCLIIYGIPIAKFFLLKFNNYELVSSKLISFFISIILGCIFAIFAKEICDYDFLKKVINKNKVALKLILYFLIFVICLLLCYKCFLYVKYSLSVSRNNELEPVSVYIDQIKEKIEINDSCSFAYFDTEDYGYLYFYRFRYYLTPCQALHYNFYAPIINYKDKNEIYSYFQKNKVKYFVVRNNQYLTNEDSSLIDIYKFNDNSTSFDDMFEKIE